MPEGKSGGLLLLLAAGHSVWWQLIGEKSLGDYMYLATTKGGFVAVEHLGRHAGQGLQLRSVATDAPTAFLLVSW